MSENLMPELENKVILLLLFCLFVFLYSHSHTNLACLNDCNTGYGLLWFGGGGGGVCMLCEKVSLETEHT